MGHTTLVDTGTLAAHLGDERWVIVDCRHDLADSAAGRAAYLAAHIPGAHFLHAGEDLSGPKTGRNGRHPLPDPASFAARLGAIGIGPGVQVAAYDAQGGIFAARLWWMLRWLGHTEAAVLDGGWQQWLKEKRPTDGALPAARPRVFEPRPQAFNVDADEVLSRLDSPDTLIVDARAPDRFRGENETLDPVGGHIPGARNRFSRDNLAEDGRFKDPARLRAERLALFRDRAPGEVIHQCGSGITACHNLLALEAAGLPGGRLYAGSWSEWSADPARPVARGDA